MQEVIWIFDLRNIILKALGKGQRCINVYGLDIYKLLARGFGLLKGIEVIY